MNSSQVAPAQQTIWQQEIVELQDRARSAFLAQDISTFEAILADDFIVNSPINRILTKHETLDLLARGIIRHFSYEEQIEVMTRRGDFVIVMGQDIVTHTPDAPPIRRRFTNVWCETAGSWQLVARHANHIAGS